MSARSASLRLDVFPRLPHIVTGVERLEPKGVLMDWERNDARHRGETRPLQRSRLVPPPASRSERRAAPVTDAYRRSAGSPPPRQRPVYATPPPDDRGSLVLWLGVAIVLAVAAVVGLMALGNREDSGVAPTPTSVSTETVSDQQAVTGTSTESTQGDVVTAVPVAAAPTPPFVQATLTGPELVLSGVVPSGGVATGLEQAAGVVYAPFLRSEVTVDAGLQPEEWLAVAPRAVMLLQLINGGTMTIADGQITVTGQASSAEEVADLERYLTAETGLPVDLGAVEITGLRPAIYVIAGSEGQVALSGALPTEEIRVGLVTAASAVYGEENVFDASTVDPAVEDTLWMYNPEALMAVLGAFAEYEVRLDGGQFSASLSSGGTFETGSADFNPAFGQLLNFGIVVMTRDPGMVMRIEGHTDSVGLDEVNQQLSQARADSVAGYMMAGGIAPERLEAIGMGASEPVASNDTAEGRALNRRIEFELSDAG